MIKKIKVTKQEIRTYTIDNDIRSYNYDEEFLKTILGETNKYEISDKNANVTWYSLKQQEELTVQDEEEVLLEELETSWSDFVAAEDVEGIEGIEAIEVLESEDYEITDAAKEAIIENFYNLKDLREIAKDKKITGRNIKKLEK